MYDTASNLNNQLLEICFDECNNFSDAIKNKIDPKYDPINLILDAYDYEEWFQEEDEESANTSSM